MDSIGYISPFVPPEWIAAHGLHPVWLTLGQTTVRTHDTTRRGLCPCAGALIENAMSGTTPGALVLTTICDQMRYASAYLTTSSAIPIFLCNIPSTWQSGQSRQLYRDELKRLGRYLVQIGGFEPTDRNCLVFSSPWYITQVTVTMKKKEISERR